MLLVTLQNTFLFKHIFSCIALFGECTFDNLLWVFSKWWCALRTFRWSFPFDFLFSTVVSAKCDYLYLLVRGKVKNDKSLKSYNACTCNVLVVVVTTLFLFFTYLLCFGRVFRLQFIRKKIESHLNCNINQVLWIQMRNMFVWILSFLEFFVVT